MWIIAQYEPTALFSLKPATATASGGKSLLVPTPYSIKMALLNAACCLEGTAEGERNWTWLRQIRIAFRPSARVVVNNTFTKVLKPRRSPSEPGSQDAGYFGRTIMYREYVYLHDPFTVAVECDTQDQVSKLVRWLLNINYFGKRGSFVQLIESPQLTATLPEGFLTTEEDIRSFGLFDTVLTQLDDVGDDVPFSRINIYSFEPMKLGVHRVLRHVALPYRRVASSHSYTVYERNDL